ncbi:hypothetical protein Dimus_018020, partial [Dionaea muscipula]
MSTIAQLKKEIKKEIRDFFLQFLQFNPQKPFDELIEVATTQLNGRKPFCICFCEHDKKINAISGNKENVLLL